MKCVRCDGVLVVKKYEGIEIDQCQKCSGIWLDDAEVTKIIENEETQFPKELVQEAVELAFTGIPKNEIESVELCPKCQARMLAINFGYDSGIVVDRCPNQHGLWFDCQELEKIQARHEYMDQQIQKERPRYQKMMDKVDEESKAHFEQMNREVDIKFWKLTLLGKFLARFGGSN